MARKLIMFGAGKTAELAHFYFSTQTDYEVIALTVDAEQAAGSRQQAAGSRQQAAGSRQQAAGSRQQAAGMLPAFEGLSIIPFDTLTRHYPPSEHDAFVAITYARNNLARRERYLLLKQMGYRMASFVSPSAEVSENTLIGDNCFILENTCLQPFTTIGNNVFIWCGSSVCHHSRIGDHSFLASGVTVSGNVTVGECCFLGAHATLRDGLQIGDQSVIGAGALLLNDVPADSLVIGSASLPSDWPASRLHSI